MRPRKVAKMIAALAPMVAIRNESARVGWPTRFATDLGHDQTWIESHAAHGEAFGWILRDDGTHIAPLPSIRRWERVGRLTAKMVADTFGAESCRFYLWDGSALRPMATASDLDDALQEIVEMTAEANDLHGDP